MGFTLNLYSIYVPQERLEKEDMKRYLDALDKVVKNHPRLEKIVVAKDLNGHIMVLPRGYGDEHKRFGFREWNEEKAALLYFIRVFGMVVVNLSFPKKDDHPITFLN